MSRTAPFTHPQRKDVAHGDYSWLESALAPKKRILTEEDLVNSESDQLIYNPIFQISFNWDVKKYLFLQKLHPIPGRQGEILFW